MTPDIQPPHGLSRFVALSSDQFWFSLAVFVGLLAATLIVEAVLIQTLPDLQGVGF